MRLFGYTCPHFNCGTYHKEVSGVPIGPGETSIKCPDCGRVERIELAGVASA